MYTKLLIDCSKICSLKFKRNFNGMHANLAPIFFTILLIGALALSPVFSVLNSQYSISSSGRIGSPRTLPLHVEGRYLKDSSGAVVLLRGIHKASFLDPPNTGQFTREGATDTYQGTSEFNVDYVAYNLDKMAEMGMNVLRVFLPAAITWINNDNGVRDRVGTVISMAGDRGIYVILSGYTVGASGGQTPIPWDPYTKSNERGIFTTSQDYINFMLNLTAFYRVYSNVVYDFWNEPNGPAAVQTEYFNVCQSLLNQLRQRGDQQIMLYMFGYTGFQSNSAIVNNNQILTYSPDPSITNVVYTVHIYRSIWEGGTVRYQTYFYPRHNYTEVRDLMMNSYNMARVKALNLPQMVTEFGAMNRVPASDWPNELEANTNIMRVSNEEGFGWDPLHWQDASYAWGMFQATTPSTPWLPPLNDWGQAIASAIASAPGP